MIAKVLTDVGIADTLQHLVICFYTMLKGNVMDHTVKIVGHHILGGNNLLQDLAQSIGHRIVSCDLPFTKWNGQVGLDIILALEGFFLFKDSRDL
jgi:hypothetical protein